MTVQLEAIENSTHLISQLPHNEKDVKLPLKKYGYGGAAGQKDELFGALRANGYGDLITETINAGSLSNFVKEQIAENEDVLPGWLDGLVNVFEKTTVGVRKQYPAHYTSGRMKRYKDDVAKKKVCADCVGGCKGYAWTNGGVGVLESIGTNKTFSSKYGAHGCPDKSANGMFSYVKSKGCAWGDISTLPEIPGIALRFNGHVGYYIGNGYAVEWRGFNYGCVRTRVKDRPWTHWYKLPFIDYSAGVIAPSDEQPEEPRPVNTTVVIVSGGGKVNVRTGFGRIAAVAPGTTYEYVATAANGWNAVVICSKVGWVSGKYSRLI